MNEEKQWVGYLEPSPSNGSGLFVISDGLTIVVFAQGGLLSEDKSYFFLQAMDWETIRDPKKWLEGLLQVPLARRQQLPDETIATLLGLWAQRCKEQQGLSELERMFGSEAAD